MNTYLIGHSGSCFKPMMNRFVASAQQFNLPCVLTMNAKAAAPHEESFDQ